MVTYLRFLFLPAHHWSLQENDLLGGQTSITEMMKKGRDKQSREMSLDV